MEWVEMVSYRHEVSLQTTYQFFVHPHKDTYFDRNVQTAATFVITSKMGTKDIPWQIEQSLCTK